MKLEYNNNGHVEIADLDVLGSEHSGIITIGRLCDDVWNAIAIDSESVDTFQCHLIGAGGAWRLMEGQERIYCNKGLKSNRLIPCNSCEGPCTNAKTGKSKYEVRTPSTPTLHNDSTISQWGNFIKTGDIIKIGNICLSVTD